MQCSVASTAAWTIIKVDKQGLDFVISSTVNPMGIDRYILPYPHGMIADNDVAKQSDDHETSNISCRSADNKLVDYWYVGGASPVGAAPTTSSFST